MDGPRWSCSLLTTIDIAADAAWWSHDVGHHQPAGISHRYVLVHPPAQSPEGVVAVVPETDRCLMTGTELLLL